MSHIGKANIKNHLSDSILVAKKNYGHNIKPAAKILNCKNFCIKTLPGWGEAILYLVNSALPNVRIMKTDLNRLYFTPFLTRIKVKQREKEKYKFFKKI